MPLFGVDTLKRDLRASAEVLDALTPGFVAADDHTAPIAETCGLSKAQDPLENDIRRFLPPQLTRRPAQLHRSGRVARKHGASASVRGFGRPPLTRPLR
jgi:hypothetical protein